ncbi:hypothetical protein L1887_19810 [Cichorium endivia]|nr:hypothetical protein L1887_19810 [Cichorium endivia]
MASKIQLHISLKESPSPPTGYEDPMGSPNFHENPNPKPNSDHESPSPVVAGCSYDKPTKPAKLCRHHLEFLQTHGQRGGSTRDLRLSFGFQMSDTIAYARVEESS